MSGPPAGDIDAYVVYGNTDLTEGKGTRYPKHVCRVLATAIRLSKGAYVQGSDAPIEKAKIRRIGGVWFGPILLLEANHSDLEIQKQIDRAREVEQLALSLGLTHEDLATLRSGPCDY